MLYSIIVPVFNRPSEIKELLDSLSAQNVKPFEVIIIEDGSTQRCDYLLEGYKNLFPIHYYYKENSGRSDTRNYGMERANGDYLIFFDSDVILPNDYFLNLDREMEKFYVDCFGGPDAADSSFSDMQKAVNHSMTSFFTTGGIRGGKRQMETFCPRTFNMGFSKKVYEKVGGFEDMFGEDIDLSIRIREAGFKTSLLRNVYVYHKRRVDMKRFFRQVSNFGQGRVWLWIIHPDSLKCVHILPAMMTLCAVILLLISVFYPIFLILPAIYLITIFIDSLLKNRSITIASLSICTGVIQILGYGYGFLKAFWFKKIFNRPLESSKKLTKMYNKG